MKIFFYYILHIILKVMMCLFWKCNIYRKKKLPSTKCLVNLEVKNNKTTNCLGSFLLKIIGFKFSMVQFEARWYTERHITVGTPPSRFPPPSPPCLRFYSIRAHSANSSRGRLLLCRW